MKYHCWLAPAATVEFECESCNADPRLVYSKAADLCQNVLFRGVIWVKMICSPTALWRYTLCFELSCHFLSW